MHVFIYIFEPWSKFNSYWIHEQVHSSHMHGGLFGIYAACFQKAWTSAFVWGPASGLRSGTGNKLCVQCSCCHSCATANDVLRYWGQTDDIMAHALAGTQAYSSASQARVFLCHGLGVSFPLFSWPRYGLACGGAILPVKLKAFCLCPIWLNKKYPWLCQLPYWHIEACFCVELLFLIQGPISVNAENAFNVLLPLFCVAGY